MRINSDSDYLSALKGMSAIEQFWKESSEADLAKNIMRYETKYQELGSAVHAFLRGSKHAYLKKLQDAISCPDLAARHRKEWESIEREYLVDLARYAGMRTGKTDDELKSGALAGCLLLEARRQEYERQIKEKGKMVQCKLCASYFHFSETERVKPRGHTTYKRVCKPCAIPIKAEKVLYTKSVRTRRNNA